MKSRSLLSNHLTYDSEDPIYKDVTPFKSAAAFYRDIFWMLGSSIVGGDARHYRRLRMSIDHFRMTREKVHAFRSFGQLEDWIRDRQLEVMSVPIVVLSEYTCQPYANVMIRKLRRDENINHTFHYGTMVDDEYKGSGWSFDLIVYLTVQGSFTVTPVTWALASFGIYATDTMYDGEVGKRFYRMPCYLLDRDIQIEEPSESKYKKSYKDFDDDEDDDEDLSESELTARWFEDGYLDDDIEGLKGPDDDDR